MTDTTSLELNGSFADFTACELLTECALNGLNGSFRFANEAKKIAVYIDQGEIVYAVSNLRAHRLTEFAARFGMLQASDLTQFKSAWNEFELGEQLVAAGKVTAAGLRELQIQQMLDILRTSLEWNAGEWSFSSLVRARENLRLPVQPAQLFIEAARKMSDESICARFSSNIESFALQSDFPADVSLLPVEAFVLSRFDRVLSLDELQTTIGIPETELRRAIYVLWLGGFLNRYNWRRAFPEDKVAKIQSAKLALARAAQKPLPEKTAAPKFVLPKTEAPAAEVEKPVDASVKKVETKIDENEEKRLLAEFLARAEHSRNHYELLGVEQKADEREIKQVYFTLAKRFHPDKFHQSDALLLKRLQKAFAGVAQAFETLKNKKSRELYDFKIRKTGAEYGGDTEKMSAQSCFENGRRALAERNFVEAVQNFARAVQLEPATARFHIAYGQALAAAPKYRHQAESEFMAAVRLEPNNAEFRLALAEFYGEQGLTKRAEGELRRVLSFAPNNAQAKRMLDNLTTNNRAV
jgi:curved DNA-binding protein CbpA